MTYEFLRVFLPKEIGRSPNTVRSYSVALKQFSRYINEVLEISIGSFEFKDCTRDCIFDFMKYLKEKGNSPSTRNYRLAALKSYLWFACDKDNSLQSIALEVKQVPQCKVPGKIRPTLTIQGVTEILKQPINNKKGLRNLVFMILLLDTAARLDELLSLTMDKMFLQAEYPFIIVRGKGDLERKLYISDLTKKHLEKYLSIYHDKDSIKINFVFYTIIHGKAGKIAEGTIEHFVQKYADSARFTCSDIPMHVFPHQFRACRATQLYQENVPLDIISRKLGHSQLETTRIYAKPSEAMQRKTLNSIPIPKFKKHSKQWKDKEKELTKKFGF